MLRHIRNYKPFPHLIASLHKLFEVYRMQSDCPAIMHATLNNEPLYALATIFDPRYKGLLEVCRSISPISRSSIWQFLTDRYIAIFLDLLAIYIHDIRQRSVSHS